jgi:tetratricopeptide (TPR) repeat protein
MINKCGRIIALLRRMDALDFTLADPIGGVAPTKLDALANRLGTDNNAGPYLYLGRAEEALAWFKRAKEIDPYFNEPWYWRYVGLAHTILHRYQEALAALDYSARTYRVGAFMAGCYARLEEIDQARASAAECLALKPEFSIGHFMSKQPFKNPADAASLAESLRLAGLPD